MSNPDEITLYLSTATAERLTYFCRGNPTFLLLLVAVNKLHPSNLSWVIVQSIQFKGSKSLWTMSKSSTLRCTYVSSDYLSQIDQANNLHWHGVTFITKLHSLKKINSFKFGEFRRTYTKTENDNVLSIIFADLLSSLT